MGSNGELARDDDEGPVRVERDPGAKVAVERASAAKVAESETELTGRPGECRRAHCFAPETGCLDGSETHTSCSDWQGDTLLYQPAAPGPQPSWSGRALGTTDLEVVTAGKRARLVALVGGAGVGKTSALATYFLRLRKGHMPGGMRFAGSFTLAGWHDLTRHLEFPPAGSRGFPPHTTSSSGRSPSMLHVRLLSDSEELRDLLFTDVPGEWFEDWAFDSFASTGADWIARNADLFVLMSDSAALAGPERGVARTSYKALAARVASVCGGRVVVPVRAKADISVPEAIERVLVETEKTLFGSAAVQLSVVATSDAEPCVDVLDHITEEASAPRKLASARLRAYEDPFLDFEAEAVIA